MRAPKTCSWRDPENPRNGCSRRAVESSIGENFRCEEHFRKSWADKPSDKRRRIPALTETEKEYIRERDFHICRVCGKHAHEVDHITEVADGGDNRPSNLQLLCDEHHRAKTRGSQANFDDRTRRRTSSRADAKRRQRRRGLYQQ